MRTNSKGTWITLLLSAIVWAAATSPLAAVEGARSVEVESDNLQIDHRARTASFRGNVVARYGELTLKCETMSVTYDQEGSVNSLKASGKVSVRRGDVAATSATARLDARLGLLVLEGSPILQQGPHRLEGSRITVQLSTGKVDVVRARGVFKMGVGTKP